MCYLTQKTCIAIVAVIIAAVTFASNSSPSCGGNNTATMTTDTSILNTVETHDTTQSDIETLDTTTITEPVELPPVETEEITESETTGEIDAILDEYNAEIIMIAKLIWGEARGIDSVTEQACVAWTVLNRVDAGYGSIYEVITAPNQFHYFIYFPTVDDEGRDLILLAQDIILRWKREQAGEVNVGRVLPPDYLWFRGSDGHNWFRNAYKGEYDIWDYSWGSPYES